MTTAGPGETRSPRFAYLDFVANGYSIYGVGAATPFIRDRLALTDTQTGLHSSLLAIGLIVAGLAASRLDRRWSVALVHGGAIACMAIGWMLLVWAPALPATLAGAGAIGFGAGIVLGHTNASLGSVGGAAAREQLARANLSAMLPAVAVPLVMAGSVAVGVGWQGAVVPALAILGLAFTGVPAVGGAPRSPAFASGGLPADYWRAWVFVLLAVSVEFSIVFWDATLVQRRTATSTADATLVAAAFLCGMVAARGLLSTRPVSALDPHRLVWVGIVLAAAGAVGAWASDAATLSAVGLLAAGSGVGFLYPVGVALTLEASGGRLDLAGARLTIASGAAILTAPFVLGALSDAVGVEAGWGLIPILAAGAFALSIVVRANARARGVAEARLTPLSG